MNAGPEELKARVLELVEHQDEKPVSQKVKLLNETLMPLFQALAEQNPTPDLAQQVPLVQGLWHCTWSTIPFQDILPGRVHQQSYQIFADNGLYANMARYRPGHNQPLLNWASRWLLSYDLMILQTYEIELGAAEIGGSSRVKSGRTEADHPAQRWAIENVGIKQRLRFGPTPLDTGSAIAWFQQAVRQHQQSSEKSFGQSFGQSSGRSSKPQAIAMPTKGIDRKTQKRYEQVYKARPQLEHLYIDHNFRLVKSVREQNQRPSYTIGTKLGYGSDSCKIRP
ncbi:MAG: hypothetical protein AAF716_15510 [Cyanobacteria bacterium P01_D01_bin.1]